MAKKWYCTVCGAESPDCVPATRHHGVIAKPCGHEQPDGLTEKPPSG